MRCSSNTGRYRVPLSSDFQTPPLAAPTKSVILPDGSRVPAMAEMRPLIAAEPILRAPRPEIVAEVKGVSWAWTRAAQRKSDMRAHRTPTPKAFASPALRAKSTDAFIGFRENVGSTRAFSRLVWWFDVLIYDQRCGWGRLIWPGKWKIAS